MPKAIMKNNVFPDQYSPTVLVVKDDQTRLVSDSLVLDSLHKVYLPVLQAREILSWVQQHQPDLIILDLEWLQIVNLELIAVLRLDWLTRNIPILVITDSSTKQFQSRANLDYDAYLIKPYSTIELEQAICSLVSSPTCLYQSITVF